MGTLEAARIMMRKTGGGGTIGPKPDTIINNGTYLATDDNLDGYSRVEVHVGQTMCEIIDALPTLPASQGYLEGPLVDTYTFKIKYGTMSDPQPTGTNYSSHAGGITYFNGIRQGFDFYSCIYNGNTMIEARRINLNSTSDSCSKKRTYNTIYTFPNDIYYVLPTYDYDNVSIVADTWRLKSNQWYDDRKYYYALEANLIFTYTYTTHNYTWTYNPGPEYTDNPTIQTNTYTMSDAFSSAKLVPEVDYTQNQPIYTDLTQDAWLNAITDISYKIHDTLTT